MSNTTIEALGYSWITNSKPRPTMPPVFTDPGPSLWLPENVANVEDSLQLTLAQNSGSTYYDNNGTLVNIWAASQAVLDIPAGSSLNFGKIVATVKPLNGWDEFMGACTESGKNTTTTLGIFTYDPAVPKPWNEIDIVEIGYQNQNEASSWINQQPGGPTNSNAQFVVQPWNSGSEKLPNWNYVHRLAIDSALIPESNEVTFLTDWQADSIKYYAAYGKFSSTDFPYDDEKTISWELPSGVTIPAPTSTMSLYINLWPYGGPTTGKTVQFQITHMEIPMTS